MTKDLKIEAADGTTGVLSSGVKSIELAVDGHTTTPSAAGSCEPGPCTATGEWSLHGGELGAGYHTIEVIATDYAGNKSPVKEYPLLVSSASPIALGPGSVNPESGDFAMKATDVSMSGGMGGLTVSRHYDSLNPTEGKEGPLGPQWTITLNSGASLEELPDGSMMLAGPEGLAHFAKKTGGGFESPPGDGNLHLRASTEEVEVKGKKATVISEYVLKDVEEGTTTRFTKPEGAEEWLPSTSEGPIATDTTTDSYQVVEVEEEPLEGFKITRKHVEPLMEVAPHPNATCTAKRVTVGEGEEYETQYALEKGCRALTFNYAESTTATGEAPSEWGDYEGQLTRVYFHAWDPATKAMETKEVAHYLYDSRGRLRAEWNPSTEPEPESEACTKDVAAKGCLATTYGYMADVKEEQVLKQTLRTEKAFVTAVDAPGQQPWLIRYGTAPGDGRFGRVISVSRPKASLAISVSAAPENTAAPELSTGQSGGGATITASKGAWSGSPLQYSYQWYRCDASGEACVAIGDATNRTYSPVAADLGHSLRAKVSATNAGGTASAETLPNYSPVGGFSVCAPVAKPATEPSYRGPECVGEEQGGGWAKVAPPARPVSGVEGTWCAEVGDPLSEPVEQGAWGDAACTNAREGGEFVRVHSEASKPNAFEASGGRGLFGLGEGGGFECRTSTIAGEITGRSTVGNVTMKFNECGLVANEIQTETLKGRLVDLNKESTEMGLLLEPEEAGGVFAKFYDEREVEVRGALIGVLTPVNQPSREFSIGYHVDEQSQVPSEYEEDGVKHVAALESDLTGSYRPFVWLGTDQLTTDEPEDIEQPALPMRDEASPHAPEEPEELTSTVEYGVRISGEGAPHSLGSSEVAAWGQKDDPYYATAIFPPQEPQGWPPSGYKRATIYYLDSRARAVNVAGPSGGIATTEYNEDNEVTRALSAANREKALEAGEGSAELAGKLDTQSVYASETGNLIETKGPEHQVQLKDGEKIAARNTVRYSYDEGAPEDEAYGLVTKTVDAAVAGGKEYERRESLTGYSGQNDLGWKLREPTSVTTNPNGRDLVHTTIYDPTNGNVLETRSPGAGPAEDKASRQLGSFGSETPPSGEPCAEVAQPAIEVGGWENDTCAKEAVGGQFVKTPTEAENPNAFTASSSRDVFAQSGEEFACQNTAVAGEITGRSTVGDVTMKFIECQPVANEIQTKKLKGKLVALNEEGTEVGLLLEPEASGGVIAEFSYLYKVVIIKGALLGVLTPVNAAGREFQLVFRAPNGAQQPSEYEEGGVKHVVHLESDLTKGAYEPAGWFAEDELASTVAGELNGPEFWFRVAGSSQPVAPPIVRDIERTEQRFSHPAAVAVNAEGDVYVADTAHSRIVEFNAKDEYMRSFGYQGSRGGLLDHPEGIAIDGEGNVWVADTGNNRVEEFTSSGKYMQQITEFGSQGAFKKPAGVAVSSKGDIYVVDTGNDRIVEGSLSGSLIRTFGSAGSGEGQLDQPRAVATDREGDLWWRTAATNG